MFLPILLGFLRYGNNVVEVFFARERYAVFYGSRGWIFNIRIFFWGSNVRFAGYPLG